MTKREMEKLIPYNQAYCYDCKGKMCPHFQLLTIDSEDYPQRMVYAEEVFIGFPGHYICKKGKVQIEYCHYLKSFLTTQDRVKDCNIHLGRRK